VRIVWGDARSHAIPMSGVPIQRGSVSNPPTTEQLRALLRAWADQPEDLARPAKLAVALAKVTGASVSQMMRMVGAIAVTVIEPETARELFKEEQAQPYEAGQS
jgi:hypothetical protein